MKKVPNGPKTRGKSDPVMSEAEKSAEAETSAEEGVFKAWRTDIVCALAFFTRLPAPAGHDHSEMDFSRAGRAVPIAGALAAMVAGAAIAALAWLGAPPLFSSAVGLGALLLATGALHEDGLADTMDGFGGGASRERKLEIMRDSRLGSYGAAALILSLLARVAALAAVVEVAGGVAAAFVLVGAAALSRAAAIAVPFFGSPARAEGAAARFTAPTARTLLEGWIIALLIGAVFTASATGVVGLLLAVGACMLAVWAVMQFSARQVGGYTGDTIGAAQQLAEIAFLGVTTMTLVW